MDTSFVHRFLDELGYFTNKKGISLLPPTNEEDILAAEKTLNCTFSPQMTFFLKQFNGGRILEVSINSVQSLGLKKIPGALDIVERNQILRTFYGWNSSWLEIGGDGFGNFYAVDTNRKSGNGEYPVVFIDHEAIGEDEASVEYAEGYFEFILEVIGEMKLAYTPNLDLKGLKTNH